MSRACGVVARCGTGRALGLAASEVRGGLVEALTARRLEICIGGLVELGSPVPQFANEKLNETNTPYRISAHSQ